MNEEERDKLRGEGETKGACASSICWAPRRSPDRGLSYKRPMGAPNRTHESQKAESCR